MGQQQIMAMIERVVTRVESSQEAMQVLRTMDTGIQFLSNKDSAAATANPALAFVRAPLVLGLWVMLGLTFIIVVWGTLSPIESATVAKGSVVLLSNKKTIQHLEGGIIEDIMVKDGDKVKAGQPLIRLSAMAAIASRDSLQEQLDSARAAESRLTAERDDLPQIDFGKSFIGPQPEERAKIASAQQRIFNAEREGLDAKLGILNQRIAQSQEEIGGLKSQIASTANQLNLLTEEIDTVQKLLTEGYATRTRLFELQRNQSDLQGKYGEYVAQIAKANQNIAETQIELINQKKEFETKDSHDMRDIQSQVAELAEKLRAATDVVNRAVITAPVGGVITGLKFHTKGGVIAPGTAIMDIVPQDDQLIIEVRVRPIDISAVHAGLPARVLFTSYKMRTTPKVPGVVTSVSADTLVDEHAAQPTSYYLARIEVDKKFLDSLEKHIELYPGMPADVLIRTGSRSFLGYLFKPITDSMHSAFREE